MAKTPLASPRALRGTPGIRERMRAAASRCRAYFLRFTPRGGVRPEEATALFTLESTIRPKDLFEEFDAQTAAAPKHDQRDEVSEEAHGSAPPPEIDGVFGQGGMLNELGDIAQDHGDRLRVMGTSVEEVNSKLALLQQDNADLRDRFDRLIEENSQLRLQYLDIVQKHNESENRRNEIVMAVDKYCKKSSECLTELQSVVSLFR